MTFLQQQGLAWLFSPITTQAHEKQTYAWVTDHVQHWVGFGPWIAFKVADMMERLGLCNVEFKTADVTLFDSPQKGAELLWQVENGKTNYPDGNVAAWAIDRILAELIFKPGLKAPPRYERLLNAQEAETILCKWKSYMAGHYQLGEDIEHSKEALKRFPTCELFRPMWKAGVTAKLW